MNISKPENGSNNALVCYVTTYNRPVLLAETLSSIVKSKFKSFRLVVIDNGGNDPGAVETVVRRFSGEHPIELVRFNSNQTGENAPLHFAAAESESDFLMLFHDDDLLHPDYLARAVAELQDESRHAFVCAYGKPTPDPRYEDFSEFTFSHARTVARGVEDLASICLTGNCGIYGATVYRRKNLRRVSPSMLQPFGKIHDRPVWCEVMDGGSCVFFNDNYVLYRIHSGQDTAASASGPFPQECIALLRYYRRILGESLGDPYGRTFQLNQRSFLREMWKWPALRSRIGFVDFTFKAVALGAATPLVFVPRFVMRFARKILRLFGMR